MRCQGARGLLSRAPLLIDASEYNFSRIADRYRSRMALLTRAREQVRSRTASNSSLRAENLITSRRSAALNDQSNQRQAISIDSFRFFARRLIFVSRPTPLLFSSPPPPPSIVGDRTFVSGSQSVRIIKAGIKKKEKKSRKNFHKEPSQRERRKKDARGKGVISDDDKGYTG